MFSKRTLSQTDIHVSNLPVRQFLSFPFLADLAEPFKKHLQVAETAIIPPRGAERI